MTLKEKARKLIDILDIGTDWNHLKLSVPTPPIDLRDEDTLAYFKACSEVDSYRLDNEKVLKITIDGINRYSGYPMVAYATPQQLLKQNPKAYRSISRKNNMDFISFIVSGMSPFCQRYYLFSPRPISALFDIHKCSIDKQPNCFGLVGKGAKISDATYFAIKHHWSAS